MTKLKYTFSELRAAQQQSLKPAFWEQLTQDEADRLRKAADARTKREAWSILALQVLAIAGGAAFGWHVDGDQGAFMNTAAAVGAAAFAWVFTVCACMKFESSWSAHPLLEALGRLADNPGMCQSAMALLPEPEARAYRDQVLASGRELLVGDFRQMGSIRNAAEKRRGEERLAQACRALHGIEDVPAAA